MRPIKPALHLRVSGTGSLCPVVAVLLHAQTCSIAAAPAGPAVTKRTPSFAAVLMTRLPSKSRSTANSGPGCRGPGRGRASRPAR